MSQLTKYAFANAKIRAMLSRLLEPQFLESLLSAPQFSEAVDLLKKTQYAPIAEKVNTGAPDMRLLEERFTAYDEDIFRKVSSFLLPAEKDFVLLLLEKFEIDSLKVALRIWHRKAQADEEFLPSRRILHPIDYAKIIKAQSIEELIVLLSETPYFRALARGREKFKEKNSLFYLEASLDVDYYERLFAAVAKFSPSDRSIARKVLGIEVDIENINWLIRLRKYYNLALGDMLDWVIPGGEYVTREAVRRSYTTDGFGSVLESVAVGPYAQIRDLSDRNIYFIENFLHEILLNQVRRALSGFPFSIGTVLGYLTLKVRETRNIISILNAKRLGWKKDSIAPLVSL